MVFTDPILNIGPDADHFRDNDGLIKDASEEGRTIGTFTPHSSPLGLVFDHDGMLTNEFAGDAFVISYNDANLKKYAPFLEPGEDLLHVHLIKIVEEDRYLARITRLVQGFTAPVDALMVENNIYVVEYGGKGSLWRVTLPLREN
jgi:glucose/arabinose dehydrogenase